MTDDYHQSGSLLIFKPLIMIFMLLTVLSCNKTEHLAIQRYAGEIAIIPFGVRSGSVDQEDVIDKIRVIVFTSAGEFVSNEVFTPTPDADNKYELSANVATGFNNIYIICNETLEMEAKLKSVSSIAQVEGVTYVDVASTTLLTMFSMQRDLQITVDGSGKASAVISGVSKQVIDVTVNRTMAKLSMTVVKNITSGPKFAVEEMSYKICRAPKYCNLLEGVSYPQGGGWRDDINIEGSVGLLSLTGDGQYKIADGVYTVPAGVDHIVMPDTYIPEHLPVVREHPDYCTYLLIETKCRLEGSSLLISAKYRIEIGNNPPTDKRLHRNAHYQIYATINSLGAMGFYAEIVPVTQVDIPVSWKPFEGYVIVSEKVGEYGKNSNIWNDYSQYSGILMTTKSPVYNSALFRYGSVVALADGATEADFAVKDILWSPKITTLPATWADVGYLSTGDVTSTEHTLDNIKVGIGDPCRLVGLTEDEIASGVIDNKLWRTPTAIELEWINTARNAEKSVNGFLSFSYLLTPISGYRTPAGRLMPKSGKGYYWSATGQSSYIFDTATNSGVAAADDAQKAYAVRCIRTTIHPSRYSTKGLVSLSHMSHTGVLINTSESFLTPFWSISSKPTEGITFTKSSGGISEKPTFSLTALTNPYNSRVFELTALGYGLDGVVHEDKFNVIQQSLVHKIVVSLKENTLIEKNGYLRIPGAGADMKFGIVMTPDPVAPYYLAPVDEEWQIIFKYFDKEYKYVHGSWAKFGENSVVTMPKNTWGHTMAIEVSMTPKNGGKLPPYRVVLDNSKHEMVFIQDVE